jgi:Tat protein secretion system quality control protein TatD with DNase activity
LSKNKSDEHDYKAIGEIGIDLFHEKKYFTQQVIAFEAAN